MDKLTTICELSAVLPASLTLTRRPNNFRLLRTARCGFACAQGFAPEGYLARILGCDLCQILAVTARTAETIARLTVGVARR